MYIIICNCPRKFWSYFSWREREIVKQIFSYVFLQLLCTILYNYFVQFWTNNFLFLYTLYNCTSFLFKSIMDDGTNPVSPSPICLNNYYVLLCILYNFVQFCTICTIFVKFVQFCTICILLYNLYNFVQFCTIILYNLYNFVQLFCTILYNLYNFVQFVQFCTICTILYNYFVQFLYKYFPICVPILSYFLSFLYKSIMDVIGKLEQTR